MRTNRSPATFWAVATLALLVLACCIPLPEETGVRPAQRGSRGLLKREPPSEAEGTQLLRFGWEDPNSVPILERRGDTFVTDRRTPADRYSVGYQMDLERLRWAQETYGVPDPWTSYSYSSDEERAEKYEAARDRCATRGIRMEMAGDALHLSPDGDWIVENSREDLTPLAQSLYDAAAKKGRRDPRGFLGVAASFVQGLEYRIPPDDRNAPDGSRLVTCGVTMPLETLQNGWGDCDTKCFLLASVLSNVDGLPAVFLEGEHHMFIGVACPPRPGDRYVTVQGIDFVLVETTTPWPLGAIPRFIEDGLQANRYRVTPLRSGP